VVSPLHPALDMAVSPPDSHPSGFSRLLAVLMSGTLVTGGCGSSASPEQARFRGGEAPPPATEDDVDVLIGKLGEPPAPVPGSPVGFLRGSFDVTDRGDAVYELPLPLPPGRGVLTPELAVHYSSARGQGLLGRGWTVDIGTSKIERCGRTIAEDGFARPVQFDDDDRLCLDGRRLVVVNGLNYWDPGAEYRTALDRFAKIVKEPSGSSGPAFVAWQKDGTIRSYGDVASCNGCGRTVWGDDHAEEAWLLAEVEDRFGNVIEYEFNETLNPRPEELGSGDETEAYRPGTIWYTANPSKGLSATRRIDFVYASRGDAQYGWKRGARRTSNWLVDRIEVRADDSLTGPTDPLRVYEFDYETVTPSNRTRLRSVRTCDAAGVCQQPTTFGYQDGTAGFEPPIVSTAGVPELESAAAYDPQVPYVMDVDGDGRSDLVYPDDGWWRVRLANSAFGAGSGATPFLSESNTGFAMAADLARGLPLDFDADGNGDLLLFESATTQGIGSGGTPTWRLLLSQGDGTFLLHDTKSPNPVDPALTGDQLNVWLSQHTASGDFNGDGLPDLLTYDDAAPSPHWALRIHDGGFGFLSPMDLTAAGATPYPDFPASPLDLDGDGVHEILIPDPSMAGFGAITFDQGALSYSQVPLEFPDAHDSFRFANVNGDALPDVLYRRGNRDAPATWPQELDVLVHTGEDFQGDGSVLDPYLGTDVFFPSDWYLAAALPLDYNRDGIGDLVMPRVAFLSGDPSNWGALVSKKGANYLSYAGHDADGDGADDPYFEAIDLPVDYDAHGACEGHTSDPWTGTLPHTYPRARQMDVDGDGLDDLVYISCGSFVVHRGAGVRDGLLTSVWEEGDPSSGSGQASYEVAYSRATDPGVYTRGANCNTAAQKCVVPAKDLVAELIVDTGSTSPPLTYEYEYEDWRVDLNGAGHLGFAATKVTEVETGQVSRTTLQNHVRRDGRYPHAGRPSSITKTIVLDNGATIEEATTRTDHLRTTWPGVHVVGLERETVSRTENKGGLQTTLSHTMTEHAAPSWYGGVTWTEVSSLTETRRTDRELVDNPADWVVAAMVFESSRTEDQQGAVVARERDIQVDMATGSVTAITRNPNDPPNRTTKTFVRNPVGLLERVEVSDDAGYVRADDIHYDDQEIFPVYRRNAELHEAVMAVDPWGTPLLTADANGLVTTRVLDTFGAVVSVTKPSGETIDFEKAMSPVGSTDVWSRRVSSPGWVDRTDYFGRRRQLVSNVSVELFGQAARVDYAYNQRGDEAMKTEPYPNGTASTSVTTRQFDRLGRLISTALPNGSTETVSYDALDVTQTDPMGAQRTLYYNTDGNVEAVEEANGAWTVYTYGPTGLLSGIHSALGSTTSIVLDTLGRRVKVVDPDLGERRWEYNAFGEVERTWSPEHLWRTRTLDRLGRVTSVVDADGTTTFDHDVFGFKGRLGRHESPDGVTVSTTYDGSTGLPKEWSLRRVGEAPLLISAKYDPNGRLDTLTYPPANGVDFSVFYEYDAVGNIVAVKDAGTGKELWRLDAGDIRGNPTSERFGNGVRTEREYASLTGLLVGITSRTAGAVSGDVQDLRYGYDENDNLRFRFDQLQGAGTGLAETFVYDEMSQVRLVRHCPTAPSVGMTGIAPGGFDKSCPAVFSADYDVEGNITQRSDLGAYSYNGLQPHAVTDINGASYSYDGNGNQTQRDAMGVTYTPFDLPREFTDQQTGAVVSFEYDALEQRVRKLAPGLDSVYFDRFYRRDDAPGAPWNHPNAIHRYVVFGYDGPVAEVQRTAGAPDAVHYLHQDHLGSTDVLSDDGATGSVVLERFSYDIFGSPRDVDWQSGTGVPMAPSTTLGYTGHELDDGLGLVNMRGRLYDPAMGRFITPDRIVQAPFNVQSLNRYSYVWNNPASLIDPTGYQAEEAGDPEPDSLEAYPEPDGSSVHEFGDQEIQADRPEPAPEPVAPSDPADAGGIGADDERDEPDEGYGQPDAPEVVVAEINPWWVSLIGFAAWGTFQTADKILGSIDWGLASRQSLTTMYHLARGGFTIPALQGTTGILAATKVGGLLALAAAAGGAIGTVFDQVNIAVNGGRSIGDRAADLEYDLAHDPAAAAERLEGFWLNIGDIAKE